MRLLLDNNLSVRLVELLSAAGHEDLEAGAIAVVGEDEIRIRSLPIGRARTPTNDA